MSTANAIIIICEALAVIALVIGFMHEGQIMAWERRAAGRIRDAAREIRRRLCERWLNKGDLEVVTRYGRQ